MAFIKKYITNSLCNRIFFYFIIIFSLIMGILTFIIHSTVRNLFISSAQSSARRELAAIASSIDSTLEHIFDYAVTVSLNESVINTTKKHPSPPASFIELYTVTHELNSVINSIMGLNSSIDNWDILSVTGRFFHINEYDTNAVKNFHSDSIIELHRSTLGTCISGPYIHEEDNILPTNEPQYVFIVSKPVVELNTRHICGYIVFFINDTIFSSAFEKYLPDNSNSNFYILNPNNEILLSSDKELIHTDFNKSHPADISAFQKMLHDRYITESASNRTGILYIATQLEDIPWTLINSIPLKSLLKEQEFFNKTFLFCNVFAFICFFLTAYIIARSATKPLLALADTMKHVTENAYDIIPLPRSSDEIRLLYKGYNHLMLNTQELLNKIYEEQEVKNDYQFRLIQSQIKPHFLYNTLEMIKSMIDLELNEEASRAISSLSIFYRLSLSRGSNIISIKDELGIVHEYLHIEKLRHMEYFDYAIHYPDSIYNYMIPKLTLQPILENAIVHGVTEKNAKGTIQLNIEEKQDYIVFIIEDDGPGIAPDKLVQLNQSINAALKQNDASFGLSSINRRIKLLFGNEFGLVIESQPGSYTKIILTIPKIEMQSNTPPVKPHTFY